MQRLAAYLRRPARTSLHLLLAAVLLSLAVVCGRAQASQDVVHLSLATAPDVQLGSVEVRMTWLGEDLRVQLEDPSGQGVYTNHVRGDPVRLLPLSVWITEPGHRQAVEAYSGTEVLRDGGGDIAWVYRDEGAPRVERLSRSMVGGAAAKAAEEALQLGRALAWNLLVLGIVLGLALVRRPLTTSPGPAWVERRWAAPVIMLVLAVVWTWPAALAGDRFMVGRHFDLPGVVWSIDASARLFPTLQDPATAWPLGADYGRFDSFTLLLAGWLFKALDPATVHGWMQVIGVWLSGWAAAWFAEVVGARRPWGLLAGLVFALSGLGANVLLEGHVFHVLDPWLPLFAGAWWRATDGRGRWTHGVLAGLAFGLTLWTSAYLGLAAAIVAIGFWLGGLRRHGSGPLLRPSVAALVTVLACAGPYLLLFLGADGGGGGDGTTSRVTSANLASLAAATDEMDRTLQSQAFALPGLALALAVLAPALLTGQRARKTLWLTAICALVLSMGSTFGPDQQTSWFPLPLGPILDAGGDRFLRFPSRLFWGGLLCLGALAAWAGTALERRAGTVARLLLLMALVEPFLVIRLPQRQLTRRSFVPSAYAEAGGPVLDLYPDGAAPPELDHLFTRLGCFNQSSHGQAIADDCLSVDILANPRYRLGQWLVTHILDGRAAQAGHTLESMGFAGVALHADLFSDGDRARIEDGLSVLDAEPEASIDGGERLVLYRLSPAATGTAAPAIDDLDTTPARSIGTTPLVESSQRLRVAVQGPGSAIGQLALGARYRARVSTQEGMERSVELSNDGSTPGDLPSDQTWLGDIDVKLPPAVQLELFHVGDAGEQLLWAGPVSLGADDDRVSFRDLGNGSARPLATAPAELSPPAAFWNGTVATIGWAAFAVVALFGTALLRRRERAEGR